MASVERGEVPPQELIKNYKVLRGGNYLRVPGELPRELARLDFELATGAQEWAQLWLMSGKKRRGTFEAGLDTAGEIAIIYIGMICSIRHFRYGY